MRRSAVSPFLVLALSSIPLLAGSRLLQRTAFDDALDRAALYVMAFEKE
jgi:hypothetical protein